ncbi:hypothetical protein CYMTET_32542, partial [Cymbomonas tetramitiformis]
ATANVDKCTDALIQATLRNATVDGSPMTSLIIAHRLDTIKMCDSVVVLSDGVVMEHGSPSALAARPGGMFAHLLNSSKISLKE